MRRIKSHLIGWLLLCGSLMSSFSGTSFASIRFYPEDSIQMETMKLQNRGDLADVYYPAINAKRDAFPVVAVLQGALVDKQHYSEFASFLARFGLVVVVPNHFQVLGPPGTPAALFTDQQVINDVLAQMIVEDADTDSALFNIVDSSRLGVIGHSFGGAAGLFAIEGSCRPPFCFGAFQRPEALRAGIFYGTNTFNPAAGNVIDVNTGNIPVALVQGTQDSLATPSEGYATFQILDGPRRFIPIFGANHYGITDINNPPAVAPSIAAPSKDESEPKISQHRSIRLVAWSAGWFLNTHLKRQP